MRSLRLRNVFAVLRKKIIKSPAFTFTSLVKSFYLQMPTLKYLDYIFSNLLIFLWDKLLFYALRFSLSLSSIHHIVVCTVEKRLLIVPVTVYGIKTMLYRHFFAVCNTFLPIFFNDGNIFAAKLSFRITAILFTWPRDINA